MLVAPWGSSTLSLRQLFSVLDSFGDELETQNTPVLDAIAAAWAPTEIAVWHGEFWIDDEKRICIPTKEVRREGDDED